MKNKTWKSNDIINFEIKKEHSLIFKEWNSIYLLFFFNIGLIIGNFKFFSIYYFIFEIFMFICLILQFYNKRNRQIFNIVFDDKSKLVTIYFKNYLSKVKHKTIQYNDISFTYKPKLFGRRKIPMTLEIRNKNKFIGEIKHKYNIGWKDSEIENIAKKFNFIKND